MYGLTIMFSNQISQQSILIKPVLGLNKERSINNRNFIIWYQGIFKQEKHAGFKYRDS